MRYAAWAAATRIDGVVCSKETCGHFIDAARCAQFAFLRRKAPRDSGAKLRPPEVLATSRDGRRRGRNQIKANACPPFHRYVVSGALAFP